MDEHLAEKLETALADKNGDIRQMTVRCAGAVSGAKERRCKGRRVMDDTPKVRLTETVHGAG